jgi:hypothetical protein
MRNKKERLKRKLQLIKLQTGLDLSWHSHSEPKQYNLTLAKNCAVIACVGSMKELITMVDAIYEVLYLTKKNFEANPKSSSWKEMDSIFYSLGVK